MRTATPHARHTVSHTLHGSHYLCHIEPTAAQKTLKQAPPEKNLHTRQGSARFQAGNTHTHTHTRRRSASDLLLPCAVPESEREVVLRGGGAGGGDVDRGAELAALGDGRVHGVLHELVDPAPPICNMSKRAKRARQQHVKRALESPKNDLE